MNEEREEAMRVVLENAGDDWRTAAHAVVCCMAGEEVSGEDIRLRCLRYGIKPHHPNAWGAFISGLSRRGLLRKTGRYVMSQENGSEIRVYEVHAGWRGNLQALQSPKKRNPSPTKNVATNAYLKAKEGF